SIYYVMRRAGFMGGSERGVFRFNVTVGNETITLPFNGNPSYTYNCKIDYGDGSGLKSVTAWNDANASHTYTAGTYEIKISGKCDAFDVNNGSIKSKIDELLEWGLKFKRISFFGCSNLVADSVIDVL